MVTRRSLAASAVLVLAIGLLAGCGPSGGSVRVQENVFGDRLIFTAREGKANVVTVTRSGADLLLHDSGDTVAPGEGCSAVDPNTVRCAASAYVLLALGDGDDRATNDTDIPSNLSILPDGPQGIQGGPGDDVLTGGSANDGLSGDEGDDTLHGNGGDDGLFEGRTAAATDVLDVDVFNGGPGADLVHWLYALQPVRVSLDGAANDGRLQEGDLVAADVEHAQAGAGTDIVIGNAGANILRGGNGPDLITGNQGDDLFLGEGGADQFFEGQSIATIDALDADTFRGGAAVDSVRYASAQQVRIDLDNAADDGRAGEADDVRDDVEDLLGGSGADTLVGDGDPNRLVGGPGGDRLTGNGGADVLRGEAGFDALDGGTESDDCDVGADGGTEANCET